MILTVGGGCLVRYGGLLATVGITGLQLTGTTEVNTAAHKLQMQYSINYPN